jgi:sugar lactone lactonase YvrE
MSGAAVLGTTGDVWNGISASSGSGISLIYSDGTASPVTMAFTSGGGYDANSFAGSTPFAGTSYDALMEDYLFNGDVAQTITLSGLPTNSACNLVLYNAADVPAAGRETFFTVNGATQSSTWNGTSSGLVPGVNYVNFTSATSDASGNLVITYTGNGTLEGDINGFQVQINATPVPPLTVSITSPANGDVFTPPATFGITANAVWSGGAVTNVQFFLNASALGAPVTAPFSVTANDLTAGDYALTAVATAGGLVATSAVVNVSVITYQTNESSAYTWTTFAGRAATGSADGIGSDVQFAGPCGITLDPQGNLYVTDAGNNTIRKITAAGVSSTIAGFPGNSGTNDGEGSKARFYYPKGITIDDVGNLYVADTHNNRIRKMTPDGTNWVVTTIAGTGTIYQGSCDNCPVSGGDVDGPGAIAQFNMPMGIAVDANNNLYVADAENSAIREITPLGDGTWNVSTIADGTQLEVPYGVAVDSATNVYVADTYHEEIRKLTPSGSAWTISTLAGNNTLGTNDGTGAAARFFSPSGITVDSLGNLYVTDDVNDTIRKVTGGGVVTTLAGSPQKPGSNDGTGGAARFSDLFGIAVDVSGNLFVADNEQIRSVTSAGVVKTLVGLAVGTGSADGTGEAARFNYPGGVAVDGVGNVFVADAGNSIIRQITSAGIVTTVAGMALTTGTNDGIGGNARFAGPGAVAIGPGGTLYVADTGNSTIRQISAAGVVNTIAGLAKSTGSADGIGTAAKFYNPGGIAVDSSGYVYVADTQNNTIRKIVPRGRFVPPGVLVTTWTVTTIAGSAKNPLGSADGTGSAAQFFNPAGITVDASDNIYIADTYSDEIRKITPVGTNWVVTTIAGFPSANGSTDGLGTNALFDGPTCVTIDHAGNLYVADQYNSTIRKITPIGNSWLVSTIGGLPLTYASQDGAGSDARFDQPDGIAVDKAGNAYVADSWNCTIRKGVFTAYGLADQAPYTPPGMNASLVVTLNPPEAGGQWRFPWEVAWRDSGQPATNLVAGNYPVEFRAVPGWLPIPPGVTIAVTNGGTTTLASQYYPSTTTVDTNLGGTLTVTLGPNPPTGSGWRFLGDTTAFYPSGYSTNLVPGTYLVEFAAVGGRVTPPNLSVQVQAGQTTLLAENYPLAGSAPSQAVLPELVPEAELADLKDFPFGFNGQLQTDVGYGSGVAVETNTVLTAAHLVFNDQTLSYVGQAYWYFQREAGLSEPEPLPARGWYILSGYAAQRTNDLTTYAPDTSTPQSRNFDVAALYFLSPAAGGGFGGYLPSDASPNPWLTGSSLKMLAGYPVDGSEFGDASINANAGRMYQTEPQPFSFALSTDPVAGQEVYTASWMFSYPGNSGGPLYVQFNGYYYPAAVYLGTLFNGITPYASAVRAIDSNVVNLIMEAALLGDNGTNFSGGGVVTITASPNIVGNPGAVQVTVAPPAAAQAGGSWKFSTLSDTDYSSKNPSALPVTTTNAQQVQFRQIPGWNLPASQSITVLPGTVTSLSGLYTLAASWSTPGAVTYGTPLGISQLNLSIPALTNGASGTYAYNPPDGTILTVGGHTLSVAFTPGDTVNYGTATVSASVNQTVVPAPLTLTADNLTQTYGQANPLFTGTIAGLQNGDNITASYSSSATTNSPAGNYPITPSLVDPNDLETNYIVSLVPGTLTITAGSPIVTWPAPSSITYGSPLGSGQLDASASVQGNFAYNPSGGATLDAGNTTLSVVFTAADTLDYNSVTDSVPLAVSPAPLIVTASDASRPSGADNPVFAGTISGLANNDNITAAYTCSATAASPAGTYAIVPSLVDPDNRLFNYSVSLVNGTLTVISATAPVIQSAAQSGGGMLSFTWSAGPNQNYQIQTTTDVSQNAWAFFTSGNTGANSTVITSLPIGANSQQFYRVVLVP